MFDNENGHIVSGNENTRNDNSELRENDNATNDSAIDNGNEKQAEGGSFGIAYVPEDSGKNGSSAASGNGYTYVSYGSGNNAGSAPSGNGQKPRKAKKNKNGHLAAVLSCVVVLCVLFSAMAAFGGTYVANKLAGNNSGTTTPSGTASGTVEILQSTRKVETLTVSAGKLMTVAEASALVKDSVVEIVTESVKSSSYLGQYVLSGAGSGVIISADGYIITNHHVVDGATKITVRLTDKTEYEAALIGSDELADIAVIKIKPADNAKLAVAVLGNSDSLVVGEGVIAIGNPLG